MARPRNILLDRLAYLALRLIEMFLHMGGWSFNYRLAEILGWVLFHVDAKHRRRAMAHLRNSFPDWPERRVRRVAYRSVVNMVTMGMEVLFTTRKITPTSYMRHVSLAGMGPVIEKMLRRDGPVILVTGHFGNWEVAGYFTSMVGLPTATIARHIDNPLVHEHVLGVRERAGQRIIDKKGAAGPSAEVMDARGVLTVVCDQDAGRRGLFVDYFGRPASTYKSIGLLAMTYRAPICVIVCRRLSRRYEFRIECHRIVEPHEWDAQDDPLRWITQTYTRALESAVRTAPEQYFWVHRRWKNRPRGQERGEDGIG